VRDAAEIARLREHAMSNLATPTITALTAGVLLIFQTLLMLAAARGRQRAQQALGDGGDERLLRAVRRHGNLAENAGIFLIGAALFEMMGGPRLWVEALCALFVLGRLSHAIGLSMKQTVNLFRIVGVALTVAVDVTLGVRLVMLAVGQLQSNGLGLIGV
jgi:uncharacterized membrane protein YecN with MAPEG domain